ncbi:hypothetical protein Pres01_10040 [Metapseudomonas resinovorans]|nr:hypothetical protein Pres01_10040 [Pseudomonas resinovorans]
MEIATGMQGDHSVFGRQVAQGVVCQGVLFTVFGGEAQALAELLAASDQLRVELDAGQLCAVMGQASTEMPLAGAPVEPVFRGLAKPKSAGESVDLLPFTSRDVHHERVGQRLGTYGGKLT